VVDSGSGEFLDASALDTLHDYPAIFPVHHRRLPAG